MRIRNTQLAVAAAVAIALGACSSQPTRNDDLENARMAVQSVETAPDAGKYAAAEVQAAHEALIEADRLAEKKKSAKDIQQAAYVAKRHADIASELISKGQAQEKTAAAEAERQKVILQAREQEAANARSQAEAARQQAEAANQQAQMTAEAAQRNAAQLEAQLRELQAKQTDRGLVLTLGDVLFDSGQSTLKPGAGSTIDRLAAFLTQSPDRSVAIEGHTDSMGSDEYNMNLSQNRALSVKSALIAKGIDPNRVVAVGKGEGVPVASNDNSAGRQQNRRVEIIISNPAPQSGLAQR
jgi:outer membrane protein OmpA-like peptidoglycan-associated protein